MTIQPPCVISAVSCLLLALVFQPSCASTEREMMPVERVVTYSEAADTEREPAMNGSGLAGEEPESARCQKYRDRIGTFESAHAASLAVGTVGLIVGLLSDDETVKEAAGWAGVLSTLAQAGTATAAEVTAQKARERGCRLLEE